MSKNWNFPPEFDKPVNLNKVSNRALFSDCLKVAIDVIKIWVERRIVELMGYDDDVVTGFAIGQLEQEHSMH